MVPSASRARLRSISNSARASACRSSRNPGARPAAKTVMQTTANLMSPPFAAGRVHAPQPRRRSHPRESRGGRYPTRRWGGVLQPCHIHGKVLQAEPAVMSNDASVGRSPVGQSQNPSRILRSTDAPYACQAPEESTVTCRRACPCGLPDASLDTWPPTTEWLASPMVQDESLRDANRRWLTRARRAHRPIDGSGRLCPGRRCIARGDWRTSHSWIKASVQGPDSRGTIHQAHGFNAASKTTGAKNDPVAPRTTFGFESAPFSRQTMRCRV